MDNSANPGADISIGDGVMIKTLSGTSKLLQIPPGRWQIPSLVIPPGVRLVGSGRAETILEYAGDPDLWAITFAGESAVDLGSGGGLSHLTLMVKTPGASGVRLLNSRSILLYDLTVSGGPSGRCDGKTGISIEGGGVGSAFNYLSHFYVQRFSEAGVNIDGGINHWANRNTIGSGHALGCGVGLRLAECGTNYIQMAVQNCGTGVELGNGARYNELQIMEENSRDYSVLCTTTAFKNRLRGHVVMDGVRDDGVKNLFDIIGNV